MKDPTDPDLGSGDANADAELPRLVAEALSNQVAHLRGELVRLQGDVEDRDRTIIGLEEVVATRDEQIRGKDEELAHRAAYIRRVTRWRRLIPGPIRNLRQAPPDR